MVYLRLPTSESRQCIYVQKSPGLKVIGTSYLDVFPIAICAKRVPRAIDGLDKARVWKIGIEDFPGAAALFNWGSQDGRDQGQCQGQCREEAAHP